MRQRSLRFGLLLPLLTLLFASSTLRAVDPVKNLSPHYRHWIEEEVPYIIESEERAQFLSLKTDAERDNFIKAFWAARNPDPGSEINTYEDEHYRRLAYANQFFGNIKAQDGWRTDQGRIYITLGEPKQRANYAETRNVRPLLIWFYESPTPALPPYFYIVFYKRSIGEPYTLYSPYQDGPSRLVTGLEGKNDQKNNLDILKRSLGDEVARTTLSLIPSEPVDISDYTPSLQSDVLLSTIKGLPDNALNKEMLAQRRANERVTTKVFLGENTATLEPAVFRDATGRMTVHTLLALDHPQRDLIGQRPDKRTGYSMTLQTSVLTSDNRSVYEQDEKLTAVLNDNQAEAARSKRFGAESRLALAPGRYQIVSTLTNDLNHVALRERAEIVVPNPSETTWGISKVLVFSQQPPIRDPNGILPFSVSGLRFVPKGVGQATLHPGEPLRILYQLWTKPSDPSAREGHKIKVHYVYGTMTNQQPHQEDEEVDAASFDPSGTLLTGRTLSTEGMEVGNYRCVISAVDDSGQQRAYASMNFKLVPEQDTTEMWTAYDAIEGSRGNAIDDFKRGLSASMQADNNGAISWFRRSLEDDPRYFPALSKLVDMLSQSGKSKEIAELSNKYPVTHEVSEQTAILMSQANAQVGDYSLATKILEAELQFQPPSAELYLALANVYQKQGNASKAEDYKQQAAKLTN